MPYSCVTDARGNDHIRQAKPSESDLVELTDGQLLLTTPNDGHLEYGNVTYEPGIQYISENGGETWTHPPSSTLPDNMMK